MSINEKFTFYLENEHLFIEKMINVNIFSLFCEVNRTFFETVVIDKIDENTLYVTILLKHLFKDLGIPQQYLQFHFKQHIDKMCFCITTPNKNDIILPEKMLLHPNSTLLSLNTCISYNKITDHKFHLHIDTGYSYTMEEIYIKNIINKFMNILINNLRQHFNNYTCGSGL